MAMHSAHENMPQDAVLADDCERCTEHARDPFNSLDDWHLARLVAFVDRTADSIVNHTTNDWIAIRKIDDVINKVNRINRVRLGYRSQAYPKNERS